MREIISIISVYVVFSVQCHAQETSAATMHVSAGGMESTIIVGQPIVSEAGMDSEALTGVLYGAQSEADSNTTRYAIRVLLGGPFKVSEDNMSTAINSHLPLENPYSDTIRCASNSKVHFAVPQHMVDWVVVELRNPTNPKEILASALGFLAYSGAVVGVDGRPWVLFPKQVGVDSVFVVVRHRNHLAVMSSVPHSHAIKDIHVVDLTSTQHIYSQFGVSSESANGKAVLIPGDVRSGGIINARDRVFVRSQTGQMGYNAADTNLDGLVNALDRIAVITRGFWSTQVP